MFESRVIPSSQSKPETVRLCYSLVSLVLQEGGVGGGGGVLRGSPLAMLAAQCNKLTTKSPPPLADAAVGKGAGFHPWKKCSGQSITSGSPEHTTPTSQPASPAQSSYTTSPPPAYGKY